MIQENTAHWIDHNPRHFAKSERCDVTILTAGLTAYHDHFITAALRSAGIAIQPIDTPDYHAFQVGKEFGNRGQCNPTYFTVGNLVKYLQYLRDEKKLSPEYIIQHYAYYTVATCGPCRFGMYITEYRHALRNSGFENFRVIIASVSGKTEVANGDGMILSKAALLRAYKALVIGDIFVALKHQIRPYEMNAGETERVISQCQQWIVDAIENRRSLIRVAIKCKKALRAIPVDRSQKRPIVAIIGEFWAKTTEGDGNYQASQFLESEGAEVVRDPIISFILFVLWSKKWDIAQRKTLKQSDASRHGLKNKNIKWMTVKLTVAEWVIRKLFLFYGRCFGLKKYHLPNIAALAKIAHHYYDNGLRGGESFLEVAHAIYNFQHKIADMTVSIKPFGCLCSSGVSDGVQSAVMNQYPEMNFLALETSGDAAANFYSRLQMNLFKAKREYATH